MTERSLEGISFGFTDHGNHTVADPLVQPLREQIIADDEHLYNYVVERGGTVIEYDDSNLTDYRLNNVLSGTRPQRRQAMHAAGIVSLQEIPFSSLDDTAIEELKDEVDSGIPKVFAYRERDRGHGKYLIEHSEQIAAIQKLGEAYKAETGTSLYDEFVVKPWVETPTDHYTSYRVTATAAGEVQAAGLLYSRHTKAEERRVIRACQDFGDPYLAVMVRNFEDPDSPYFLNAKDIRSNIFCGGSMIPLMGDNRQSLQAGEAAILKEHGLSIRDTTPPQDMLEVASAIGRVAGPISDLVLGIDFIQDLEGNRHVLEVNCRPTGRAYNICHLGGLATMNEAMRIARLRAVDGIAAKGQ